MAKKAAPIRELGDVELVQRLEEEKARLFGLRFENATGKLDNSARIGQVRKEVARLNTILREREIAAAEAQEGIHG